MRVLHVINQLPSQGGAEVSLRDLILATHDRIDHGVAVLRTRPNHLDAVEAVGTETFVPAEGATGWRARLGHVDRAVERFRPDLVHTTLFDANVVGRVVARRRRVPCLVSLVNTPYEPAALVDRDVQGAKRWVVQSVDRVLSRFATTGFHAITEAVAESAVRRLGVDRSRITIVARGRDAGLYAPADPARRAAARAALGLDADDEVLLTLGREEPQKGHTYLLDAVAALAPGRPRLRLVQAGRTGSRTPAIEARLAGDPDLAARVQRLGRRTDVPDLLAAADAFVFPSLYEGLGVSVIEALASGVPVVAGDNPAVREVLDDGRCGLLVPTADAGALAKAIEDTLDDPGAARARVAAGRERFLARYELGAVADAMIDLWQATAAAGAASR